MMNFVIIDAKREEYEKIMRKFFEKNSEAIKIPDENMTTIISKFMIHKDSPAFKQLRITPKYDYVEFDCVWTMDGEAFECIYKHYREEDVFKTFEECECYIQKKTGKQSDISKQVEALDSIEKIITPLYKKMLNPDCKITFADCASAITKVMNEAEKMELI